MAFTEGQPVLLKRSQLPGTIHRKLSYLQDLYVVQLTGSQNPNKQLAHETDLEPLSPQQRLSA